MAERPLILFPDPPMTGRRLLHGGPDRVHRPSRSRQGRRLQPQFRALRDAFVAQRARLAEDPAGVEPEQVVVLETVGTVDDFDRAVSRVPGLEWLADIDIDDIPPDEEFYLPGDHQRYLGGRLYLVIGNQEGIRQLLSLWSRFRSNPTGPVFPYGLGRWRLIFEMLRDVHPWGAQDRLRETGFIEDVATLVGSATHSATVEFELWYRRNQGDREAAQADLGRLISAASGQIVGAASIDEISYHGIVVELPVEELERIAAADSRLIESQHVTYVRPMGQAIGEPTEPRRRTADRNGTPTTGIEPRIALLDGMPIANHVLLQGRVIVDDPDGWAATYPAVNREHGTAMASLVIHGDLGDPSPPLSDLIYVRPVLRPESRAGTVQERLPNTVLPVDLIYRSVVRMKGSADTPGAAPAVVVVNHAVADPSRMFDRGISAWGRVLDFLAWRYRLLVLVSAGNRNTDLELLIPRADLPTTAVAALQSEVLKAMYRDTRNRRLAAPAESINSLTVGALHGDAADGALPPRRIDPIGPGVAPSPMSAHGPGYRRSVKPEILMNGGRQTYSEKLGSTHQWAVLQPAQNTRSHGVEAAAPGRAPADLRSTAIIRGTSAATALATREAARILAVLDDLRLADGGDRLTLDFYAVLTKAMLVHGASWDGVADALTGAGLEQAMARLCGYGPVRRGYSLTAQDERATLLGWGVLHDAEANRFELPLPASLSGRRAWRRVTITLAWLTPTNVRHRAYRRAAMWFDPYGVGDDVDGVMGSLGLHRVWTDFHAPRRGTVQHEVFEAETTSVYPVDATAVIQVNCRADAGGLGTANIPYALVVSMEVAPDLGIGIYDEIEARIRPRVGVEIR